jgi:4-aminobutyrate aminotransferase-like enzyme
MKVPPAGFLKGLREIADDHDLLLMKLLELGIIVNDIHGHTIRISPPLNISNGDMEFLVECLKKSF